MSLTKFAATLRTAALAAPLAYENSKGQATFMYAPSVYATTFFRCLNTPDSITALALCLEKSARQNFAFSTPPAKARVARRESMKAVIKRFTADQDHYNAKQLDALQRPPRVVGYTLTAEELDIAHRKTGLAPPFNQGAPC